MLNLILIYFRCPCGGDALFKLLCMLGSVLRGMREVERPLWSPEFAASISIDFIFTSRHS